MFLTKVGELPIDVLLGMKQRKHIYYKFVTCIKLDDNEKDFYYMHGYGHDSPGAARG